IPCAALSSVPLRLFGTGGLTLLPFLSGLLLLAAIAALARIVHADAFGIWSAIAGVALGTPVWFYAHAFWEHLPAACLATCGLVLVLRAESGGGRVAALLGGLAVGLPDAPVLFALAVAAVPLVVRGRGPGAGAGRSDALRFLAGVALCLVPLGVAQWLLVHTPFGLHATAHGPFEHGFG